MVPGARTSCTDIFYFQLDRECSVPASRLCILVCSQDPQSGVVKTWTLESKHRSSNPNSASNGAVILTIHQYSDISGNSFIKVAAKVELDGTLQCIGQLLAHSGC